MSEITFDHALFSAECKKQFGNEILTDLESGPQIGDPGTFVPTSSEQLNACIGIGGIPLGRIIEIYGPESSGKTTIALDIIANLQKMFTKRPAFFGDDENSLSAENARGIGVDTSKKRFILCQEVETETLLNVTHKAAKAGAIATVVDSIAGLSLKSDMESDETTDARVGGNSKAIRAHLRAMNATIPQTQTVAIYINHITYKIGVVFGNPETTPGGGGLKFFASVRLDVRKGENIKDTKTGEIIGHKMKVKVAKNKVGSPFRTCEIDLIYGQGIDRIGDLIDASLTAGVLAKSGNHITFGTDRLGLGRGQSIEALKANPKFEATIRAALHKSYEVV